MAAKKQRLSLWRSIKLWFEARRKQQELETFAIGINSTVDFTTDEHIIMLDYDVKDVEKVKQSVRELQEFWKLGDADLFRTRNGHHVFFWYDQVPYERVRMIVDFAKYVDPLFKYISRYYDHKTIRVAGKYRRRDIQFVETLRGIRVPTAEERVRGDMKRQEHKQLLRNT